MYSGNHKAHIAVTEDPEQVMPCHDSAHGSPPFTFHPFSCPDEFMLVNSVLSTETAWKRAKNYYIGYGVSLNKFQILELLRMESLDQSHTLAIHMI